MADSIMARTAAAMTLAQQVVFLKTILESSTEYSIVAKDLNGNILAWNEGARRIYGHEAKDVIGKSDFRLYHHPDDVASGRSQAIFEEVRATGKWVGALRQIRKNGNVFIALATITLRRAADCSPIGFTLMSQELTESQRTLEELKESREYNRSLIESNIDALMTTDPLGIIRDVNRQMCEMTGFPREELVGSPFKRYFTDPERAEEGIALVLAENRVTNFELVMRARTARRLRLPTTRPPSARPTACSKGCSSRRAISPRKSTLKSNCGVRTTNSKNRTAECRKPTVSRASS